jgi:hypothetical protein
LIYGFCLNLCVLCPSSKKEREHKRINITRYSKEREHKGMNINRKSKKEREHKGINITRKSKEREHKGINRSRKSKEREPFVFSLLLRLTASVYTFVFSLV